MSQASMAAGPAVPGEGPALPPAVVEAVVRAVAAGLSPRQGPGPAEHAVDERADLPPLLSPGQVATLTGWSRQTVDRLVDAGELPSVVVRRGARQRMVRVPKRFVLQMLRQLDSGTSICLADYTAQWAAAAADSARSGLSGDQAAAAAGVA